MFDEQEFSIASISLSPINFFSLELECSKLSKRGLQKLNSSYRLPSTSDLCQEVSFAQLGLGWNKDGIVADIEFSIPFQESCYPYPEQGDSVELFIDTRDMKSAGFNTRFCHHFCFLPQEVNGFQAGEITHFRTEDAHELCDPSLLEMKVNFKKTSYFMYLYIPAECLVGYDPEQFNRLGFTYRINRFRQPPQHLSVISTEYPIDQHPALWSSLRLIA